MSDIGNFIAELNEQKVRLWLDGGALRFSAPKGILEGDRKKKVVACKEEIIRFLANQASGLVELRPPGNNLSPLSFSQKQLWLLNSMGADEGAYNFIFSLSLRGPLDPKVLADILNKGIARHEAMRTTFSGDETDPIQEVHPPFTLSLPFVDLSTLEDGAERARQIGLECLAKRIDLTRLPLINAVLIKLAPNHHELHFSIAHIVFDGWSMGVWTREFGTHFTAALMGTHVQLPPVTQYIDYVAAQIKQADPELEARQQAFWVSQLSGVPALDLPRDFPRPAARNGRGDFESFQLPPSIAQAVKRVSREVKVTLFTVMLSAYEILLHRYSGEEDFAVGIPSANRAKGTEGTIGHFVNMLPIRAKFERNKPFRDILTEVYDRVSGALHNGNFPFEKMVYAMKPERDASRGPIFQVSFAFQNLALGHGNFGPLTMSRLDIGNHTSKFDLGLEMVPADEGYHCTFNYDTNLYTRATILRMAQHFSNLVSSLLAHPDAPIWDAAMLGESELKQLERLWSNPLGPFARPAIVHEEFAYWANKEPNAVAVVDGDITLSYAELNARADRLAHLLAERGVGPEVNVAVFLGRSSFYLISILGIFKAGGCYVPLSPAYPRERIAAMMERVYCPFVITQATLADRLPDRDFQVLTEEMLTQGLVSSPNKPFLRDSHAQALAYIMFTSGSTGLPKAVGISHGNIMRLIKNNDNIGIIHGGSFLHMANPAFDASTLEIWGPLLNGGRCVIYQEDSISLGSLEEFLAQHEIDGAWMTSAFFNIVVDEKPELLSRIKFLSTGGDVVSPDHVWRARKHLQKALYHGYGPTETTTFATIWDAQGDEAPNILPLGSPINGTDVYILDRRFNPAPIGVPGEMCIGGAGVARGYLGQPGLSADRFLPDPYGSVPGNRLYRSGDLGRFLPNGLIEFIGRVDSQVKIRGFRIELGEIQEVLLRHPLVLDAVALVDDLGEKRLIAAIREKRSADSEETLPEDLGTVLRLFLGLYLPEYMVPSNFILLEEFPLTANGKTDRKRLVQLVRERGYQHGSQPAQVRTLEEQLLQGIWSELLGMEPDRIGADSNFFRSGGHSLLATRLVAKIRSIFKVELPLLEIFSSPSLAEMAAKIALQKCDGGLILGPVPANRDQPLPLSFAQQRLWFLYQLEGPSATYNMPMSLRLAGQAVALSALEQSFRALIQRHESLRTRFVPVGTDCFQQFDTAERFSLLTYDLRHLPGPEAESLAVRLIAADLETPFLLEDGNLLRALAVQLDDTELVLHFNMHHILSDGWSMALMTEELVGNYLAFSKGLPSPYQPLKIQYADYAVWQHELFRGPILQEQLAYWTKALADAPVVLDLPTRGPRPAVQTFSGQNHTFHIPASLAQSVKTLARRSDSTPFMILGSVFGELLGRYAGTSDVLVGTPIANRRFIELEPLIGFFVNTLVLRYSRHRANTVTEMLGQTRNMVLNAFAYQDVPFEQLVEVLNPVRDLSRSPLFQVMFTLENGNTKPLLTGGMIIEPIIQEYKIAKFDLSLSLTEQNDSWLAILESNADLFEPSFSERLGAHFLVLLESILGQPDGIVASLPMVTLEERQRLVMAWNTTETNFADPEFIISRFESWATNTPEEPALWLSPETSVSYAALECASREWAQRLRQWGCGPETRVGLALGREKALVVALLAVLRNGSAYVPLEPNLPVGRLHFLIEDAACSLVLTTSSIAARCQLEDTAKPLIFMDQATDSLLPTWTKPSPLAQQAVYVLYTSGSTGRPKGVLISHEALTQKLMDLGQRLDLRPGYRHLLMAPMGFDPFAEQLLLPLTHGGVAVLVAQPAELEPQNFWALIQATRCDVIDLVPSMLAFFLDEPPALPLAHKPTYLLLGGETLNLGLLKRVRALNGFKFIYNYYGPTEATIDALAFLVPETLNEGMVPIGSPMANYAAYVLDSSLQLLPVGVTGGLYLGGSGLARGYLNQPSLTAESFLPDPFALQPGSRLYRTGDLTRRRDDGNLVFYGREDHQVKLRGVRVELGEIEAALRQLDSVAEAVVILVADRLVAFVVPTAADPEPLALTAHLSRMLPPAQVPQVFSFLATLPMTPNGKHDLQALRDKAAAESSGHGPLSPPTTEAEKLLANLWSLLLSMPIDQIGRQSNFFAVGGHSLLATRLVASVRKAFSVELPLRDVFAAPSLEALAARISAQQMGATVIQGPVPISRDQPLPLSFAQQRLWFLYQLEGPSPTYNMPSSLRIEGEAVDLQILTQSFEAMIQRHEIFRTRFVAHGEQMSQVEVAAGRFVLPTYDFRGLARAEAENQTRALIEDDINTPFCLEKDLLLRAFIVQLGAEELVLHINMHHIVSDGWSMNLLTQELVGHYTAFRDGLPNPFQPLAIQYGDYAVWQKNLFSGPVLQEQLNYWTHALADAPFVLDLPIQKQRPAEQTFNGALEPIKLSSSLSKDLQRLAQRTQTTLFMVLESAFAELMARYSDAKDILIGTPVANRRFSELEPLIGFFVNTLVLRNQLSTSESVSARLARVREMALGAFAHQDLPFEQLVAALNPERDLSRSPLFQVLFILQNNAEGQLAESGLSMTPLETGLVLSKFDLSLSLSEAESGLVGGFEYNRDLFEPAAIVAMVDHYVRLLEGFVQEGDPVVATLPMLSAAERQFLLCDLNACDLTLERDLSLATGFFRQAELNPNAVALVHEGQSVSYAQLVQRACQLARAYQDAGVLAQQRVAILLDRHPDLLASLLATLVIGATYVPLDPAYPQDRLTYMLVDAGCSLLVTRQDLAESSRLSPASPVLYLESLRPQETTFVPAVIEPAQLAYLIYTSGSTGKPKAVAISHFAATSFLAWAGTVYSADDLNGVLAATSVCFDLSIFELFLPATCTGTLYLIKDILALAELAEKQAITLVNTVPSAAAELIHNGWLPPNLRVINLAGEPLSAKLVDALYQHPTIERVYDLYGPSEDTTYSTYTLRVPGGPATIGRPITGTRAFVLDALGQPVVMGGSGELVLAGDGLAQGYLGQPGQTAARFVPDPYSHRAGTRMYRTGDLAAYLADGNLRLLGRIDHQVKLRGFRIELEEIQRLLESFEHVQQALVLVAEVAGDQRLIAFVKTEAQDLGPMLKDSLAAKLPAFMLPSQFHLWTEFPSLPNGKVDRRTLLDRARLDAQPTGAQITAQTEIERSLVAIFAAVLGLESQAIGTKTSFFELGGHSLLATRLVAAIRQELSVEVSIRNIFAAPSVQELARLIETTGISAIIGPVPVTRDQPLPLSFAQSRLWFLSQLEGPSATYNMPLSLRLTGEAIDLNLLQESFRALIQRHESLRTRFVVEGLDTFQVFDSESQFSLTQYDLRQMLRSEAEEKVAQWIDADIETPFLLDEGRLIRALAFQLSDEELVLHINMHHIVSDGWSMNLLTQELLAHYTTFRDGLPSPFQPLAIQYGDYAVWQKNLLSGPVLQDQLNYWTHALADAPFVLDLPSQKQRPAEQTFNGALEPIKLSSSLSKDLQRLAQRTQTTLFMVLESAFAELMARYSGSKDILIGTPVANRRFSELEPLIGFFVNTLVLRNQLSTSESVSERLARVREMALAAFAHQDLPFEQLVATLNPERDLSRSPLFQVMFVLQNTPQGEAFGNKLSLTTFESGPVLSKFDLTLNLAASDEGYSGSFEYNTDLFTEAQMAAMADHYARLLEGFVGAIERPIAQVPMLSDRELQFLLQTLNAHDVTLTHDPSLATAFFRQAKQQPLAIALVHEGRAVSYGQLVAKASQIALSLRAAGVGPEDRVGILLERTPELLASLLAALALGAAYVPLDPAYPQERLAFMLADAGCVLLCSTEATLAGSGLVSSCPTLFLEALGNSEVCFEPTAVAAAQLAYLIYTSGSTGKPKAVAISHHAATSFLAWAGTVYAPADLTGVLAATSVCFDLSIFELFLPATCAGTVYLVKDVLAVAQLAEFEAISLINTVPSAAAELIHNGWLPPNLRVINLAGEPLSAKLVDALYQHPTIERVYDLYGPSEDTTYSTFSLRREGGPATIGRPIVGTSAYILNQLGLPVVMGGTGELALAGDGLARGYLGQPGQTAARFVPDPYTDVAGERMYRTGDLAAYLPDGNLRLLGRIDHQVKLRGYRIELDEIERQLESLDQVAQAVVLVGEVAGDKRLLAFVKTMDANLTSQLQAHLIRMLPGYMVPSQFVLLAEMPSLPNGKTDRRALLAMAAAGRATEQQLVRPTTEIEQRLVAIFAQVLGLEASQVSTENSFFALGGHSLLLVRVAGLIEQTFQKKLSVAALFRDPTVQGIAALVEQDLALGTETLLHLNETVEGQPWFLIHPVGGQVHWFLPLARAMATVPVYGIQARGLYSGQPAENLETMVTDYAEEIVRVQPQGPYRVLGWSAGGTIALELARELERRSGQSVDVVLLDAYRLPVQAIEHGREQALQFLADLAQGRTQIEVASVLAASAECQTATEVWAKLEQRGLLPEGWSPAYLDRMFTVHQATLRAVCGYEVRSHQGRTLLIRAAEGQGNPGWQALDRLTQTEVPGDHYSMLQAPSAQQIAKRIKVFESSELELVAYFQSSEIVDKAALAKGLGSVLPHYMVPSTMIQLEQMPLLPNGKINRKLLPEPDVAGGEIRSRPPESPLEKAIAEVWCKHLSLHSLGAGDNFFEVGGNSLKAVGIFTDLKVLAHGKLELTDLSRLTTVEQLAQYLEEKPVETKSVPAATACLLPLRGTGSKDPLFLVHAVGGDIFAYRSLVRHMDSERPVYGLQAPGLYGGFLMDTIEEIAAFYVAAIREKFPNGPYLLGGWSMGGLICTEMTQQLHKAGEKVNALILIDSFAVATAKIPLPDEGLRLSYFLERIAHFGGDSPEKVTDRTDISTDEKLLQAFDLWCGPGRFAMVPDITSLVRAWEVFNHHYRAMFAYQPGRLPLKPLLIRASENNQPHWTWDRGWAAFCRRGLEIIEIKGNHNSVVAEAAATTAKLIDGWLDRAK